MKGKKEKNKKLLTIILMLVAVIVFIVIISSDEKEPKDPEPLPNSEAIEKFWALVARTEWSDLIDYGISHDLLLFQWDTLINNYKNSVSQRGEYSLTVSGKDSIGKGANLGDRGTRTYTVTGKVGQTTYVIVEIVFRIRCEEVLFSGAIKVDSYWFVEQLSYGLESVTLTKEFPWENTD